MEKKVLNIGYKVNFSNSKVVDYILNGEAFLKAEWFLKGSEIEQEDTIRQILETNAYDLHCNLYGGDHWIAGHTLSEDVKLTWIIDEDTITEENNNETWRQLNSDLIYQAEGEENTIEEIYTEVYNINTKLHFERW